MQENKEHNNTFIRLGIDWLVGVILGICLLLGIFIIPDMVGSSLNSSPTKFGLSDTFKLVE